MHAGSPRSYFVCWAMLSSRMRLPIGWKGGSPHRPQQRMRVRRPPPATGRGSRSSEPSLTPAPSSDQRLVTALHDEQADGLLWKPSWAQVRIRRALEGAQPARQGDETVGQLGRTGLCGYASNDHPRRVSPWPTSHSSSARGSPHPRPPVARQASATMPIRPTFAAAGYTSSMPARPAARRGFRRPPGRPAHAVARAAEHADAFHGDPVSERAESPARPAVQPVGAPEGSPVDDDGGEPGPRGRCPARPRRRVRL